MFSGRENVLYLIKNNKVDFDKNIAFEYLGNNDNLYNKLIKEYVNNHKTLDDEMIIYLENNNYQKLYHKIHDIKGLSLYLGSKVLYEYGSYLSSVLINYINENKINITLFEEIKLFIKYYKNYINELEKSL